MYSNMSEETILLTWCYDFGCPNWGQVMQCYALYRFCEENGQRVKVIRYRRLDEDECYEDMPRTEESRDEYENRRKKKIGICGKQDRKFSDFISNNVRRTPLCYNESEVKRVCKKAGKIVIGSDQLWNPAWFDSVFCPDYKQEGQTLFSYATSGISALDSQTQAIIRRISERISSFDYVSVREKMSADILSQFTNKKIEVVLDPTFLISKNEWKTIASKDKRKGEYVLCFCYGEIQYQKHILKGICSKHGIDSIYIVKMNGYFHEVFLEKNMKLIEEAGPQEILTLISSASIVCTDSFHGFAFSIIFGKTFYLLERTNVARQDASPERINEVCRKLGIGNRWVSAKKEDKKVDKK